MKNKFGRFTIFMVLVLLSWLAISPIADAQTPAPPLTRESLIQEIQSRAQRDVNNGKPMETTEGLDRLFGEQAKQLGMPLSEVVNISAPAFNLAFVLFADTVSKNTGGIRVVSTF